MKKTTPTHPRFPQKDSHLWLDELSTKEVEAAVKKGVAIILPVGSVEEHGDHLPLCTDSVQPEYVALEVAKRTRCLLAPPLRYGLCNTTRNFPGTISLKFDTLYAIIRDILTELIRNGFSQIIVLSGHAGQFQMSALKLAATDVTRQQETDCPGKKSRIMVLSDYDFAFELAERYASLKDGHAGTIETSRMMAIKPDLIKGTGQRSFPEMPRFEITAHPEQFFSSGVIGDPTIASAAIGHTINEYIIEQVEKLVNDLTNRT